MNLTVNPDTEATIDRWFATADDGDWVGVFENQDLGHPDLGCRIAGFYGADQWDRAEIGRTPAPDTEMGLGWRYILVEKCKTAEEAKEAMAT